MTDELRHILDEPQDITFLPPERTAAAPGGTLWRGFAIPYVQSPIPKSWLKPREKLQQKRYDMGPILLDAVQRGHWDYSSAGETGLGRHWSMSRAVAERFAMGDEQYSMPVVVEIWWDATGEDPDQTNVNGYYPEEQEITLLPGTPVRVTNVYVRALGMWWSVLQNEEYRTADLKTAAEPGGVLPYDPVDFGYAWQQEPSGEWTAVTRDGKSTLFLTLDNWRADWRVYDDIGLVEKGNFQGINTSDVQGVLYRADRLLSEFDENPIMPSKTFEYREDYTEDFPSKYPEIDFREP